jgi:predicted transcriptional regulator of viral defense system
MVVFTLKLYLVSEMVYNYKEILEKYKSDYSLKKALDNKEVYKIENGLYSDYPNISFLKIITKKYPYAIISGMSAYYFYGLTNVIPEKITVCTGRNSTYINNDEIKQIRMIDKLYKLGIVKFDYVGTSINIYNKERLLIDLARNKNRMGYDLYKEIVSNYRKIVDELDMSLIEDYLNYFNDGNRIYQILMSEVF